MMWRAFQQRCDVLGKLLGVRRFRPRSKLADACRQRARPSGGQAMQSSGAWHWCTARRRPDCTTTPALAAPTRRICSTARTRSSQRRSSFLCGELGSTTIAVRRRRLRLGLSRGAAVRIRSAAIATSSDGQTGQHVKTPRRQQARFCNATCSIGQSTPAAAAKRAPFRRPYRRTRPPAVAGSTQPRRSGARDRGGGARDRASIRSSPR